MLKRSQAFLIIQLTVFCTVPVIAQVRPAIRPAPTAVTPDKESSITLQQIIARQEEHYRQFKNMQGAVVWQELQLSTSATTAPPTRVISFASEGDRSVNLVLPLDEYRAYGKRQGKLDWKRVLAAHLVAGDEVLKITAGPTGTPIVESTPFNPAVHENNPLVAYHPRQLADERVPLRELVAAIPGMPAKPRITRFTMEKREYLRIEFSNPAAPGESIYYFLDPAKAYLPIEVGRMSGGKPATRAIITIGRTKDNLWIPARKEKATFDSSGRQLERESWHYEHFAVNEGLAPKTLTLFFFQLPQETKIIRTPAKKRE